MAFDPTSDDATFSRILTQMENFGDTLTRIEARQIANEEATSLRLKKLEDANLEFKVRTGMIAFLVTSLTMVVGWWVEWRSK
jgi:hypothetical protein